MLTIREAQMQSMASSSPGRQMIKPCQTTWIEIRLMDTENRPIAGDKYRIRLPDSSIVEGTLDEDGKARLEGIVPGQCEVCFPNIDGKEWRRA
jgi:hypothetical protein